MVANIKKNLTKNIFDIILLKFLKYLTWPSGKNKFTVLSDLNRKTKPV